MKTDSIYSFTDYRGYLHAFFEVSKPGTKTKVAEALGVHTSLLPQVMGEQIELSLEQAEKFNKFLGHDEEESFYFILLVLKSRAGTIPLKKRMQQQIDDARKRQSEISHRIAKEKTISEEDQERFYSSYIFAAIHVLSSIPEYSTTPKIAAALGRPENEISRAVDFLLNLGVLHQKDDKLTPGSRHVHLPPHSPRIVNHHLNWRFKAIEKIRENPRADLHYSGALSLSEQDVLKIKEILASAIADVTAVATKSPEETAYVLCADFFTLMR
ncbi:TIGR02147 family protein [Bdellovibrio sp. HCB288]|uniref:TIGR02147 family protein n=1 Tax=Bdellovibrio sp. HCB288 TaxID=3394355 RepID=UPI0039B50093